MKKTLTILTIALMVGACGDDTPKKDGPKPNKDMSVDQSGDMTLDQTADVPKDIPVDQNKDQTKDTPSDLPLDMMDMSKDMKDDQKPNLRTLSDYRRCVDDNDCPVGLGSCIKEIPLSHKGIDGVERVSIRAAFPSLAADEGICTNVCTNNASACNSLSVNGATPDPEPYVCQIIALGATPYPTNPPAYPFEDSLDKEALRLGQPFGAICRPPFQLDDDISTGFCDTCAVGTRDCEGGALCFNRMTDGVAQPNEQGLCLSPCGTNDACPLGFECQQIDNGSGNTAGYCMPLAMTCTDCLDIDGDGRGAGRCGQAPNAQTPVDCDDKNKDIYHDPMDPKHAFPTFCGSHDYNCNGLSDDAEQIGTADFGASHCTVCNDRCDGQITDGFASKFCQPQAVNDGRNIISGQCIAKCTDPTARADCDGDITNGCESPINDPTRLYYRDLDGDKHGDPNDVQFACDPNQAPHGYVRTDNSDCDDSEATVYGAGVAGPAAPEICDGLNNDCNQDANGNALVDDNLTDTNVTCTPQDAQGNNLKGECGKSFTVCSANGLECPQITQPTTEICNGEDNDCDGIVDNPTTADMITGAKLWYIDADGDGFGDKNAAPIVRCSDPSTAAVKYVLDNTDCNDGTIWIRPNIDESCENMVDDNCDGIINKRAQPTDTLFRSTTHYRDEDGDGYGVQNNTKTFCAGYADPGWAPIAANGQFDCKDTGANAASINPGEAETCATDFDDNCDGITEAAGVIGVGTYYRDNDGDGYGRGAAIYRCNAPTPADKLSLDSTDCNDNNININPGALEICDGVNNSCQAVTDKGCPLTGLAGLTVQTSQRQLVTIDTNADGQPDRSMFGGYYRTENIFCPTGEAIRVWAVDDNGNYHVYHNRQRAIGVAFRCVKPQVVRQDTNNDGIYEYVVDTNNNDTRVPASGQYGIRYYSVDDYKCCGTDRSEFQFRSMDCDGNSLVRYMGVRAGSWLDQLGGACYDVNISTTTLPATINYSAQSSNSAIYGAVNGANASFYHVSCPQNQVAVGVRLGYRNSSYPNWMSAIGLYCAPMQLNVR